MKKIYLGLLACLSLGKMLAQPTIQLTNFASGFTKPVDMTHCGDDRKFVVEQDGRIKIINGAGQTLTPAFLDISGPVHSTGNEQGLLGLAFHPDYANNGYFYVNYTTGSGAGTTRISRFSVDPADSNRALVASEQILLTITQPFSNHNGGQIKFGPDGYLYIGMGDGGSAGDPGNRSQNPQNLLGKMLRIDVNTPTGYLVPASNPFATSATTLPEIWALGVRNPWRFSFDPLTGDMWIADVGQDAREEINFQAAASTGGENYGWRCFEANASYNSSGCGPAADYDAPIHFYSHGALHCSVSGGYVSRTIDQPHLWGKYIYTDFCSGYFWGINQNTGSFANQQLLNAADYEFVGFGEDSEGGLYALAIGSGIIYRLNGNCTSAPNAPVIDTVAGNLVATGPPAAYYQWFLEGQPILGANSGTFAPSQNGNYQLLIQDANTCGAVSSTFVLNTGTQTFQQNWAVKTSPNPFNEQLMVEIPAEALSAETFVRVLNINGQEMLRQQVNSHNFKLDGSALVPGVYLLEVSAPAGRWTGKVVKQ